MRELLVNAGAARSKISTVNLFPCDFVAVFSGTVGLIVVASAIASTGVDLTVVIRIFLTV